MPSYYLVEGHLGSDGWERVDESNPNQIDEIEETCGECFDNDWVVGQASTLAEARELCGHHYQSDYGREMFQEFRKVSEL